MCTVYVTVVYKYDSILQYFSVLSFLLHMIILCLSSFSKKLSSFFLESRVMLCMYTLYFKRSTLYKFIEINSVLFCSTGQKAVGKVGTHQILGNYIWWLRSRSVRSLCNWTSTETLGFTSSNFKVSFPLSWL